MGVKHRESGSPLESLKPPCQLDIEIEPSTFIMLCLQMRTSQGLAAVRKRRHPPSLPRYGVRQFFQGCGSSVPKIGYVLIRSVAHVLTKAICHAQYFCDRFCSLTTRCGPFSYYGIMVRVKNTMWPLRIPPIGFAGVQAPPGASHPPARQEDQGRGPQAACQRAAQGFRAEGGQGRRQGGTPDSGEAQGKSRSPCRIERR